MTDMEAFTKLIQDKKKIGCYTKIDFGEAQLVQFSSTISLGVISNEQGTIQVKFPNKPYSVEDVMYFYPYECANTFTSNIDIGMYTDTWINNNLVIHYDSDNYRKYIGEISINSANTQALIKSRRKTGCYSKIQFSGSPQYMQFVDSLPTKGILSNKQGTTMAVCEAQYLVKNFTYFYPYECAHRISENIRIEVFIQGQWLDSSILLYYNGDSYRNYVESSYTNAYHWVTFGVGSFFASFSIINMYLMVKDKGGYKTTTRTENGIRELTGDDTQPGDMRSTVYNTEYGSPHIAAKYAIFTMSALAAVTSTMLMVYGATGLVKSSSLKQREEEVIYSSESNNNDKAIMISGCEIIGMLTGTALMLVPATHKNNGGGFTYDLHAMSKRISFIGGAVLFISGAVFTGVHTYSSVKEQKPIGIELEPGRAIDLISLRESTTYFSYSDDGALSRTSWVGPNDAILFYDFNGTNQADHWSKFVMTEWSEQGATSDFDALLEVFDTNHDMLFDAQDALYSNFYIWQDANSNGAVEAGELTQLTEAGIVAIDFNTAAAATPAPTLADTAVVEWADGHTTLAHDLTFQYETESTSIATSSIAY